MWQYNYTEELYHHGIKGMKWGVRRYQNKDGSLTAAGKRRVKEDGTFKSDKEYRKEIRDARAALTEESKKRLGVDEEYSKADDEWLKRYEEGELDADDDGGLYKKAEALAKRSCEEVDAEMRKKYGSDYTDFVNREKAQTGLAVAGTLVVTSAFMLGTFAAASKGLELAGNGIIKLVEIAIDKASKR